MDGGRVKAVSAEAVREARRLVPPGARVDKPLPLGDKTRGRKDQRE